MSLRRGLERLTIFQLGYRRDAAEDADELVITPTFLSDQETKKQIDEKVLANDLICKADMRCDCGG